MHLAVVFGVEDDVLWSSAVEFFVAFGLVDSNHDSFLDENGTQCERLVFVFKLVFSEFCELVQLLFFLKPQQNFHKLLRFKDRNPFPHALDLLFF